MADETKTHVIPSIEALLLSQTVAERRATLAYLVVRFSEDAPAEVSPRAGSKSKAGRGTRKARKSARPVADGESSSIDLPKLVNALKNSDDYSTLEKAVLDKADTVNRIVLALELYRKVYGESGGMTSGEIARFYDQLNIRIGVPNVSTALSSRASKLVITDGVRTKGAIMRYRLSRSGIQAATELVKAPQKAGRS